MQNQNIPGKPACHQGFSPPFSCWQPPAIGDTLNHLGADWSLKRRSKNETRYHRDQATTGHCILKNPPGCLVIITCLLITNFQWHLTNQWIRASHTLVWSSNFPFSSAFWFCTFYITIHNTPRRASYYISIQNNMKKGARACLTKLGGTFAVLAKMKSCFEDLRSKAFQWGEKGLLSKKRTKKGLVIELLRTFSRYFHNISKRS